MANKVTETNGASARKEAARPSGGGKAATVQRRDGLFQRIGRYLREVQVELRKTTWPTKPELINSTKVVLGTVLVVGIYLALVDWLLTLVTGALGFWR